MLDGSASTWSVLVGDECCFAVEVFADAVERSDAGRIVTVSSNEHKGGGIDFDDLQLQRG